MPSNPSEGGPTKIRKRSIVVNGRKTSVSLEQDFMDALVKIARQRKTTIGNLVSSIDTAGCKTSLSSAVRLFVLAEAIAGRLIPQSTDDGEELAPSNLAKPPKARSTLTKALPGRAGSRPAKL